MPRSNKSTKTTFKYDGTQPVPKDVEYAETLPGIKIIADRAFEGCNKLKWIIFREGVEKIGACAFDGCQTLEGIKLPSTLTEIGDLAFGDCYQLREVVLNEGLKRIGAGVFRFCRSLEGIACPSTLTEIGNEAFFFCPGLREVALNEGLKKIGDYAFFECQSLGGISCPSTLTEIGERAFFFCTGLREVVINECLKKIGDNAFENCRSLVSLKFPSIPKQLGMIDCESDKAVILREIVLNAIDRIGDVSMVDGEVLISRGHWGGNNWMSCKRNLDHILNLIAHVQMKEATTTFELALWKEKMTEESVVGDENRNREACRIDVPGPVKYAVMQFARGIPLAQFPPHTQLNYYESDGGVSDNSSSSVSLNYYESDGDVSDNSSSSVSGRNHISASARRAAARTLRSKVTVVAPPGKLGILLANRTDSRGTVVGGVRTSSVLAEQVSPGDRIIAIDEEDVSQMNAKEITTIMARKSEFERVLVLLAAPKVQYD
eukprot:CAMPEP_0183705094 /NCGR_PEP_ID=MMETSP0737-20130205/2266_1 /TAXON_ID=385413 /ORGANISM="Thalassiosira miniscula, Strain CCMP1093" /LENGTH=489 /DNA_ID=CAMNT_0025932175 /DNA_START=51 /DNA_END=1520 /DNA_ORIENTATION=+